MMQAGVSSYAFGWAVNAGAFTTEALIDFAVEQQVSVVQFGDHVPLHKVEPRALDALAAKARSARVEIETGARGLTLAHLDAYLEVSRRLRSRLLRFVVDNGEYRPDVDTIFHLIRDALPDLRAADVTLAIENHDRLPCATLRHLVDDLASTHVGICLDTANSLGAGEGIHEVLEALAPVCVNLHLKDYCIERLPHLMGFTVTGRPLGEGDLPIRKVLDAVRHHNRCQTAIVETWPPPENEMSATLAKEMDWAKRSVKVLRAVLSEPATKSFVPTLNAL